MNILSTVIVLGQLDHDDITRSKSLFLNDNFKTDSTMPAWYHPQWVIYDNTYHTDNIKIAQHSIPTA